jgi:hypothetical protein
MFDHMVPFGDGETVHGLGGSLPVDSIEVVVRKSVFLDASS